MTDSHNSDTFSDESIREAFLKFDRDHSNDLDQFELADVIHEIFKREASTNQIMSMIRMIPSDPEARPNCITLKQFTHLVRSFDWEKSKSYNGLLNEDDTFELELSKEKLGFRVKSIEDLGLIVVSKIVDPELNDKLSVNDVLIAVNGAPLGFITDHKVLQQKVKTLKRPVRVTLSRNHAHASHEASNSFDAGTPLNNTGSTKFSLTSRISSIEEDKLYEEPSDMLVNDDDMILEKSSLNLSYARERLMRTTTSDSDNKFDELLNKNSSSNHDLDGDGVDLLERVTSANVDVTLESFDKFKNEKGDLDIYMIMPCLSLILDMSISSTCLQAALTHFREVIRTQKEDNEEEVIRYAEFQRLVREVDWGSVTSVEFETRNKSNEDYFEVLFEEGTLGFKITNTFPKEFILVSKIMSERTPLPITVGDMICEVNGINIIGNIIDQRILAKKIKSVGRPLKITFKKTQASQPREAAGGLGMSAQVSVTETTLNFADSPAGNTSNNSSIPWPADKHNDSERSPSQQKEYFRKDIESEEEATKPLFTTFNHISIKDISEIFQKYSLDHPDDKYVDIFEMIHMMEALLHRYISTPEMILLIEKFDLIDDEKVDYDTFLSFFNENDFSLKVLAMFDRGVSDIIFENDDLGIELGHHQDVSDDIVVTSVINEQLPINVGVSVIALNGVPLQNIANEKELALKLSPLGRPLRLTFMTPQKALMIRNTSIQEGEEGEEEREEEEYHIQRKEIANHYRHFVRSPPFKRKTSLYLKTITSRSEREEDESGSADADSVSVCSVPENTTLNEEDQDVKLVKNILKLGTSGLNDLDSGEDISLPNSEMMKLAPSIGSEDISLPNSEAMLAAQNNSSVDDDSTLLNTNDLAQGSVDVMSLNEPSLISAVTIDETQRLESQNESQNGSLVENKEVEYAIPKEQTNERGEGSDEGDKPNSSPRTFSDSVISEGNDTVIGVNGFTYITLVNAFTECVGNEAYLDVYNLAPVLKNLLKREMSTPEMMLLATEYGQYKKLDLMEFLKLFWEYDFNTKIESELGDDVYEVNFEQMKLGIGIGNGDNGKIVVITVKDDTLPVLVGDSIIAMNGVPLQYITDHKDLAVRLSPLDRPVRLTFMPRARLSRRNSLLGNDMLESNWEAELAAMADDNRPKPEKKKKLFHKSPKQHSRPSSPCSSSSSSPSSSSSSPSSSSAVVNHHPQPLVHSNQNQAGREPEDAPPTKSEKVVFNHNYSIFPTSSPPLQPQQYSIEEELLTPKCNPPRVGNIRLTGEFTFEDEKEGAAVEGAGGKRSQQSRIQLDEVEGSEHDEANVSGYGIVLNWKAMIQNKKETERLKRISLEMRQLLRDEQLAVVNTTDNLATSNRTAPSRAMQFLLIDCGQILLKLVNKRMLQNRHDELKTLKLACALLDRAMLDTGLPCCYDSLVQTSSSSHSSSMLHSPNVPLDCLFPLNRATREAELIRSNSHLSETLEADPNIEVSETHRTNKFKQHSKSVQQEQRLREVNIKTAAQADANYWYLLAEAHWLCYDAQGLKGDFIHCARSASAFDQARQWDSNLLNGQFWSESLKPLLRLGALNSASKLCDYVESLDLEQDLPQDFEFCVADIFAGMKSYELANAHMFNCFMSSGPPKALKQQHLLFAMAGMIQLWIKQSKTGGVEDVDDGRAAQAKDLFTQSYALFTLALQTRQAEKAASEAMETALACESSNHSTLLEIANNLKVDADSLSQALEDENPSNEISDTEVAAWLDESHTWISFGDIYTAGGFHFIAADCYRHSLQTLNNPRQHSPSAWYRIAKADYYAGKRIEALDALGRAIELEKKSDIMSNETKRRSVMQTKGFSAKLTSIQEHWKGWAKPNFDGGCSVYAELVRAPFDMLLQSLPVVPVQKSQEESAASAIAAAHRGNMKRKSMSISSPISGTRETSPPPIKLSSPTCSSPPITITCPRKPNSQDEENEEEDRDTHSPTGLPSQDIEHVKHDHANQALRLEKGEEERQRQDSLSSVVEEAVRVARGNSIIEDHLSRDLLALVQPVVKTEESERFKRETESEKGGDGEKKEPTTSETVLKKRIDRKIVPSQVESRTPTLSSSLEDEANDHFSGSPGYIHHSADTPMSTRKHIRQERRKHFESDPELQAQMLEYPPKHQAQRHSHQAYQPKQNLLNPYDMSDHKQLEEKMLLRARKEMELKLMSEKAKLADEVKAMEEALTEERMKRLAAEAATVNFAAVASPGGDEQEKETEKKLRALEEQTDLLKKETEERVRKLEEERDNALKLKLDAQQEAARCRLAEVIGETIRTPRPEEKKKVFKKMKKKKKKELTTTRETQQKAAQSTVEAKNGTSDDIVAIEESALGGDNATEKNEIKLKVDVDEEEEEEENSEEEVDADPESIDYTPSSITLSEKICNKLHAITARVHDLEEKDVPEAKRQELAGEAMKIEQWAIRHRNDLEEAIHEASEYPDLLLKCEEATEYREKLEKTMWWCGDNLKSMHRHSVAASALSLNKDNSLRSRNMIQSFELIEHEEMRAKHNLLSPKDKSKGFSFTIHESEETQLKSEHPHHRHSGDHRLGEMFHKMEQIEHNAGDYHPQQPQIGTTEDPDEVSIDAHTRGNENNFLSSRTVSIDASPQTSHHRKSEAKNYAEELSQRRTSATNQNQKRTHKPQSVIGNDDLDVMLSMFDVMDKDGDGTLGREEVESAMRENTHLCISVHEASGLLPPKHEDVKECDLTEVFRLMDLTDNKPIKYSDFKEFIGKRGDLIRKAQRNLFPSPEDNPEHIDRLMGFEALFAAVDKNGDGDLTKMELLRAMNRDKVLQSMLVKVLGLPEKVSSMSTKNIFETVFDCIDGDNTQSISLDEFINFIDDMDNFVAMQHDENLPHRVQALLAAADRNNDGNLSNTEIIRALNKDITLRDALKQRKSKVIHEHRNSSLQSERQSILSQRNSLVPQPHRLSLQQQMQQQHRHSLQQQHPQQAESKSEPVLTVHQEASEDEGTESSRGNVESSEQLGDTVEKKAEHGHQLLWKLVSEEKQSNLDQSEDVLSEQIKEEKRGEEGEGHSFDPKPEEVATTGSGTDSESQSNKAHAITDESVHTQSGEEHGHAPVTRGGLLLLFPVESTPHVSKEEDSTGDEEEDAMEGSDKIFHLSKGVSLNSKESEERRLAEKKAANSYYQRLTRWNHKWNLDNLPKACTGPKKKKQEPKPEVLLPQVPFTRGTERAISLLSNISGEEIPAPTDKFSPHTQHTQQHDRRMGGQFPLQSASAKQKQKELLAKKELARKAKLELKRFTSRQLTPPIVSKHQLEKVQKQQKRMTELSDVNLKSLRKDKLDAKIMEAMANKPGAWPVFVPQVSSSTKSTTPDRSSVLHHHPPHFSESFSLASGTQNLNNSLASQPSVTFLDNTFNNHQLTPQKTSFDSLGRPISEFYDPLTSLISTAVSTNSMVSYDKVKVVKVDAWGNNAPQASARRAKEHRKIGDGGPVRHHPLDFARVLDHERNVREVGIKMPISKDAFLGLQKHQEHTKQPPKLKSSLKNTAEKRSNNELPLLGRSHTAPVSPVPLLTVPRMGKIMSSDTFDSVASVDEPLGCPPIQAELSFHMLGVERPRTAPGLL